ncbi:MAG: tetratricopeptide repeat protein [Ktedonobacteraceae bacterium]
MDNEEILATKRIPKVASSRLRQERERRGWSQSELARRIGTTQVNISRWEKGSTTPGPYFRQRLGELFDKSLEELGLFTKIEDEGSDDARPDSLLASSLFHFTHLPLWNVPYRRNPFFTGREEILTSLYTVLNSNLSAALTQAQAISGLGGIGKTQIAVEYAYRYRADYQAIMWVTASSRDALLTDFVMLAALLDLPEQYEQDQDIIVRAVKRWLVTHENWLLILDNVDDLEMINDFLPMHGTGNFLLTTRLQALGSIAQSIEVEKMGLDEGVMFLLRRTKALMPNVFLDQSERESQEQAEAIVTALDGLPLALDQAGAYIEETRCGFAAYLNLYRTRRKELLLRRGSLPVDHPEPVAATWSLSFQKVEQESFTATNLLRLLAFLNPEAIPEEIITEGIVELGSMLSSVASDSLEMDAAIELLLRYSLLRRNPEAKSLSIHRLVQAVLRDGMDRNQQFLWAERTIRAVNRAFPDVELKTWAQCRRCLPHAQIGAIYIEEYELAFSEAGRLLNQAANYLSTHAQYAQAEPLLQQSLAIREQVLEPGHPDTASSLSDLGVLYLTQGKYQQSAPLLQQALEIREHALGLEHPNTAASLNSLALLYYAQGKYALAEQLYQQALHILMDVLEPEHPDIAQSLSNLAELYTVQGKYAQAESLYLQALDSQKNVLGLHHPNVAKTLNNLALCYRSKGEYPQAEKFYQQALSIQEQVLGPKHPDVAQTLNNLARLYRAQGEYTKAKPFYQRALNIREDVFGPDHPHVAQSLYGLAKLYNSQGKYLQAEELGQRALSIQEQRLGIDHPDLAYTLGMLAKIYQAQHKLAEAKELNIRALRIQENTSDANHPHIALINNNLAEIYHAQGKYHEAKPLIAKSLEIHSRVLGPEHPYMAYSLSNQAENFFMQGDYVQAEVFFKKALAIRKQNLGTDHPRTASTYHNLARLYSTLGRYEEAEPLYRSALAIREQALGPEHPAVAMSLEYYAILLRMTEREKQACELEARAQAIKVKQVKPVS